MRSIFTYECVCICISILKHAYVCVEETVCAEAFICACMSANKRERELRVPVCARNRSHCGADRRAEVHTAALSDHFACFCCLIPPDEFELLLVNDGLVWLLLLA